MRDIFQGKYKTFFFIRLKVFTDNLQLAFLYYLKPVLGFSIVSLGIVRFRSVVSKVDLSHKSYTRR